MIHNYQKTGWLFFYIFFQPFSKPTSDSTSNKRRPWILYRAPLKVEMRRILMDSWHLSVMHRLQYVGMIMGVLLLSNCLHQLKTYGYIFRHNRLAMLLNATLESNPAEGNLQSWLLVTREKTFQCWNASVIFSSVLKSDLAMNVVLIFW